MKEVILGDVTGHWVAGILHGNHVESEYMRKGQEVRLYQFKASPPEKDKRGKNWLFEKQTIIVPVKQWVALPSATSEVTLTARPQNQCGW